MTEEAAAHGSFTIFGGAGELAKLMRAHDWTATPLGSPHNWPQPLRTAVTIMLGSKFPMWLAWGETLPMLYNDAYAEMLGTKHPQSLAKPLYEVWSEIRVDLLSLIDAALGGEAIYRENLPLSVNRGGHEEQGWFTFSYSPLYDDEDGIAGVFCAVVETTQTVLAELHLRELNETLESRVAEVAADLDRVWRNASDIFLVIDPAGAFRRVNPATTAILGWTEAELIGRSLFDFIHPDDIKLTLDALARAREAVLPTVQNRYRTSSGEYRTISWVASPEGALIYAYGRDVTLVNEQQAELEVAQDALRQAQKMEAVGQLTGGLAHDFNNLLMGVLGNLELLETRVARGRVEDLGRFVTAAQGAGKRAAALTQRLLAFARRQTLDPKPTSVNKLIAGLEDLLRRTMGPSYVVEVVQAGGLWVATIDAMQLENAILNLCINARDAMPSGGRLTIETANKWLDDRTSKERGLPPGQYLSVCVTDTGTGMTPEVAARAFDPFYTTKPIGEGTGLGLSMIYGFARQSGGQVRIYSEVGEGTTVCIYLPRHLGEAADIVEEVVENQSSETQGQTVLVVDDEATIRHLISEVLEELGYIVIGAADGAAGLKALQSDARIELLITDVGLPNGMNGRQVADAARALRPGLKVLFITGYAENAAVGNGHMEAGMELLTKPFSMTDLTRKAQEMLAS
jgi:PAS domain S-box-containing protein